MALGAIGVVNALALVGILVLPGVLAGPNGAPTGTSRPADAIAIAGNLALDQLATPSPSPTPTPTAQPTATPSPSPSPSPTHRATPRPKPRATPLPDTVAGARQYVKNAVGLRQYNCIDYVWTRESKWNPRAGTPSGAYGIPQAFPGSKMAAFGSNWLTSPLTQVKWGLWYVKSRYGSACGAYSFFLANGWY